MLCYCGNVHPASTLEELLHSIATGPALVRQELGQERLSFGLWLSAAAMKESLGDDHTRLKRALEEHAIDVWTMNAFPLGTFHGKGDKHEVYRPSWADPRRLAYTENAAQLLADLLPMGDIGSISSLPVGYAAEMKDAGAARAARENLCKAAAELARIGDKQDRHIRLCLEPEPACLIETGADAVAFFAELRETAHAMGLGPEVEAHLGLCIDACHHAVAFEEAVPLLADLAEAEISIGKVQLSSAIHLDPSQKESLQALRDLDEPHFLHQVRALVGPEQVVGVDDIDQIDELEKAEAWRVHYHVPIHTEDFGPLLSTQYFLEELMALMGEYPVPHYEVETYTWNVLPDELRPKTSQSLAKNIAEELRYAKTLL